MEMIIVITKNEIRSENLIDYYIVENNKHFDRSYYHYYKIDKKKIVDYTIDDRIAIVHKIIDLDLIAAKSF